MSQNREHEIWQEILFGDGVERVQVRPAVIEEVFIQDGKETYVSARPIYQRRYLEAEGEELFQTSVIIEDVPYLYNSTSKYANWNPPVKGDTGVMVYSDHAFDKWWDEGEIDIEPDNTRTRNRSDAYFLPMAWAKPKFLSKPSDQWMEMRNLINDLRVAISDEEGVHLQHQDWQQILNNTGYDVIGQENSLMTTLETGFTAAAEGFFADGIGWAGAAVGFAALGQTTAAATSAAAAAATEAVGAELLEIVELLLAIHGGASAIEREEGEVTRP